MYLVRNCQHFVVLTKCLAIKHLCKCIKVWYIRTTHVLMSAGRNIEYHKLHIYCNVSYTDLVYKDIV